MPLCDVRLADGMSEAGDGQRGRADAAEEPSPPIRPAASELGKGWVIRCLSGAAAPEDTVMKFGRSSIASAEQMNLAANLVLGFSEERPPPVVVLSAMGNTTTNLHLAAEKALRWGTQNTWEINELEAIKDLHLSTIDELGLDRLIISGSLDELKQLLKHVVLDHKLTPKTRDLIVSYGEVMSTIIFSAYLNKLGKGAQQEWASSAISTVGSGGSDLTAITIARELQSREIVVWKDVNGLFTCDPNVFASALPLPYLTFDEATALGFFAPQSMQLSMESGIPVIVKSLYIPQASGTMLTKTREMNESELTRIMLTSNLTMLEIKSTGIVDQSGFVTKAFSIFTKFGISVDHASISQGEILMILVPSKLLSHELIWMKLDVVIEELQQIAVVHPLSHRSFISLIGTTEMSTAILEKAFGALTRIDVKTQMSSHGSSKAVNIFLVVNDDEAKDCAEALHTEFFEKHFVSEVQGVNLDAPKRRKILGSGMSTKIWEVTVEHAKTTCVLSDKVHVYYLDSLNKTAVVFNAVGQVRGFISEKFVSVDDLTEQEKAEAHAGVKQAYEHWENVLTCDDKTLLENPLHLFSMRCPSLHENEYYQLPTENVTDGFVLSHLDIPSVDIFSAEPSCALDPCALGTAESGGNGFQSVLPPLDGHGQPQQPQALDRFSNSLVYEESTSHPSFSEDYYHCTDPTVSFDTQDLGAALKGFIATISKPKPYRGWRTLSYVIGWIFYTRKMVAQKRKKPGK